MTETMRRERFKFERLEVWSLSLDYVDAMYDIAGQLPPSEHLNLASQLKRAATSVALNIAEGSTGQSDAEQVRFLGFAIRSLLETVACQQIIRRRHLGDVAALDRGYDQAHMLAAKLHRMRAAIAPDRKSVREDSSDYEVTLREA